MAVALGKQNFTIDTVELRNNNFDQLELTLGVSNTTGRAWLKVGLEPWAHFGYVYGDLWLTSLGYPHGLDPAGKLSELSVETLQATVPGFVEWTQANLVGAVAEFNITALKEYEGKDGKKRIYPQGNPVKVIKFGDNTQAAPPPAVTNSLEAEGFPDRLPSDPTDPVEFVADRMDGTITAVADDAIGFPETEPVF